MNKKLLVIAMTMSAVLATGCGTNDTRVATSEIAMNEQPESSIETTQPILLTEVMLVVDDEHSVENMKAELETAENERVVTEEAVEIIPTPETLQFYYASNEYELRDDDLAELSLHAKYMVGHPEIKLKITGHTDQSGSKEYNQSLAMKRADNVAKILVKQGVMPEQISIYSQGGSQPIAGLDHSIRDRRVEFEYYSEMQLSEKQLY